MPFFSRYNQRREPQPLHNDGVVQKDAVAPGAFFHRGLQRLVLQLTHARTPFCGALRENRLSSGADSAFTASTAKHTPVS